MTAPIVAIGGGGFLMEDLSGRQERYLLSFARPRSSRHRVLYVGTASGDAERAQLKFMKLFSDLGCDASTLPFFPYEMKRDYAQAVRDADIIYVGGGNTVAMVAIWREFGFDAQLRDAWNDGTLLCGISAGANCWFENYITDSVPGGGTKGGLGFISGTFCPHLDGEPWRQPLLAKTPGSAWGAPDGVMVRFEGGQSVEAVTSREGQQAVQSQGGVQSPMPTRVLLA